MGLSYPSKMFFPVAVSGLISLALAVALRAVDMVRTADATRRAVADMGMDSDADVNEEEEEEDDDGDDNDADPDIVDDDRFPTTNGMAVFPKDDTHTGESSNATSRFPKRIRAKGGRGEGRRWWWYGTTVKQSDRHRAS